MTEILRLAQALIACRSVTPIDDGAMGVVEDFLKPYGFRIERLRFGVVENLYARIGTGSPHLCFAGHVDVVPPGDEAAWTSPPFEPALRGGKLYGRGASDMKAAVAAFLGAGVDFLRDNPAPSGSLSYLVTGDEEAESIDGTAKVVGVLKERGEKPDYCIVGEPTAPSFAGETIKNGRRGNLSAVITLHGTQGHSAYPQLADNPVPKMLALLQRLNDTPLDGGTEHFEPSRLVLTGIDTGNAAYNVIPAKVTARVNIRFNDRHSGKGLSEWLEKMCRESGARHELKIYSGTEPFVTEDPAFAARVSRAAQAVTGRAPVLSTAGGTSDARFIRALCPVLELGPSGATAHKVDENIALDDLEALHGIYLNIIEDFLCKP